MNYLEKSVGVYKKSEKGFYRHVAMTLGEVFNREAWDHTVIEYRKTKTKDNPKGDRLVKNKIMAYMPAGDYGRDVPRKAGNPLKSETNQVQLDFDQPIPTKRLKELFNKYKWISVAQTSCGGQGFYLLVNTEHSKDYVGYFWSLVEFFESKEKLKVDVAVSSINEIRFVSLTSELMFREDPTVYTNMIEQPVSVMEKILIPLDGEPIPLPDEVTDIHYADVISWAGKNNANGVPVAKAIAAFPMARIGKKSHLYKKDKVIAEVITNVYERYQEQHGEAVVTPEMLKATAELDLVKVQFSKEGSTQALDAKRIIDAVTTKYQFKASDMDTIYRYCGTHWEPINIQEELIHFLSNSAIACGYNRDRAALPEFKDLLVKDLIYRSRTKFETPLTAFNLNNGVLIFKDGEVTLQPHSDTFNFTYMLDYAYDPEVKTAPAFTGFIDRVIPDKDTQRVLFDYISSGFIDNAVMKIERTLILLGAGANGKSTILDLLAALFGDAVGRFSLERITDPAHDTAPKEMRNIHNKVFGLCSEARTIKDFNIWKAIVSKETLSIKSLYKDSLQSNNYGRLITCMNEIPNIESVQGAMRRLIIINMGVQIPEIEQDRKLVAKLSNERSFILNRIIDGYRRVFINDGEIKISEVVKEFTDKVIDESDQVIMFIRAKGYYPFPKPDGSTKYSLDEKIERMKTTLRLKGNVEQISPTALYNQFTEWWKEEGNQYPIIRKKFLNRLRLIDDKRAGGGGGFFSQIGKMSLFLILKSDPKELVSAEKTTINMRKSVVDAGKNIINMCKTKSSKSKKGGSDGVPF